MSSRILLLEEHFGAEDAVSIKQTLSGSLAKKYPGMTIDTLSERFSLSPTEQVLRPVLSELLPATTSIQLVTVGSCMNRIT